VRYEDLQSDQALEAMVRDKKSKAGRVRFVLPKSPGQVEYGIEVPEKSVHETLKGLK
jgi:3-dehydroquinate synthetase